MTKFGKYIETLERLAVCGLGHERTQQSTDMIRTALDGGPSAALTQSDSLKDRRAVGAFFTGNEYAGRMVARWKSNAESGFTYVDPACGSGDLLLAVAQNLPVRDSLHATLDLWGERLTGFDVDPRFIAATKSRLVLFARWKTKDAWHCTLPELSSLFPRIMVADGLTELPESAPRTRVVMNPPFTLTKAPPTCTWSSGSVSAAAVFTYRWVDCLPPGSELVVLLPDVLRSGSRYARWRKLIGSSAQILDRQQLKQFSPSVDVDVFVLALRVGAKENETYDWWALGSSPSVIQDLFKIKVGTVVPHRHLETGPLRRYLTARDLPVGVQVDQIHGNRRFSGTVFKGPFVTVRRTSRPGERRCRATLVAVEGSIAVENHLLVLSPRDGSLESCRKAMEQLNSRDADEWLDQRIRCRHLTVPAVGSIPLQ